MTRNPFLALTLFAGLFLQTAAGLAADSKAVPAYGMNACGSSEKWRFAGEIREDFVKHFEAFLSRKNPEVSGFSNALGLRRIAQTLEARTFAEYWISRALFEAKLYHIAHNGFAMIAARTPSPENVGIQAAALECLLRIEEKFPSMALPTSVTKTLLEYATLLKGHKSQPVLWEAAHQFLRQQLAENASSGQVQNTLTMMSGSGAYDALGKALVASKKNEHGVAIKEAKRFLDNPNMPSPLKRYLDQTHILLARSYYALQQFERSVEQYKLVNKRSNELAATLSEMSWAYLMQDHYSEAIGTAIHLQAGGLRKTYAPEAPMVMAMALNELCQYPESVRAVHVFRKFYEDSFRWLAAWNQDPAKRGEPLYPLAVDYLKKKGKTPERIASEWVRSPLFISDQDEINLLFDEQESTVRLGKSGAQEQNRAGLDLIAALDEVTPRYKTAKKKQKPGEKLPADVIKDLKMIREKLAYYQRLQRAAPVWHSILANYQKQVPTTKNRLMAEINEDLKQRSVRMLEQLDEIAENIQLIEVEIFNGASQDIIWQNAHPDYKKVAKKIQDDSDSAGSKESGRPAADQVWNWGKTSVVADADMEIWEDELGSFQASLFDNCSSKDRYLALKVKERRK